MSQEENFEGNIIQNYDFTNELCSWHFNCCDAYVVGQTSGEPIRVTAKSGSSYAVVTNRTETWHGLEQDLSDRVSPGCIYLVSACVRVGRCSGASCSVQATLRLENNSTTDYVFIGRIEASEEKWEQLEGEFVLNTKPDRVVLYFEGPPPGVDLLIDSVLAIPSSHKQLEASLVPKLEKNIIEDHNFVGTTSSVTTTAGESILKNPRFDDGLKNWSGRGCKIFLRGSEGDETIHPYKGKRVFACTGDRCHTWNGIEQEITEQVQRKLAYEMTCVVRLCEASSDSDVQATLWVQYPSGREDYISIAKERASSVEWTRLRGKFLINGRPSRVVIFLEGPPSGTDFLIARFKVKRAKKLQSLRPHALERVVFGENIIKNSSLEDELFGWHVMGSCTLRLCHGSPMLLPHLAKDSLGHHLRLSGRYILATDRSQNWMGPAQTITGRVLPHTTYQVSAWVRVGPVSSGPQDVNVALCVGGSRWVNGGRIQVNDSQWHEIAGSFRLETSAEVAVFLQGPAPGVDLMVAGLNIFAVDRVSRFAFLQRQTDMVRKRDVVVSLQGGANQHMWVKVRQVKNSFPFGACLSRSALDNEDLVDFFLENFNWAVFANELKWAHTEPERGAQNYDDADEMLAFCERHGIPARAHCLFWEVEETLPVWVRSLSQPDLSAAVRDRVDSLLAKYRGRFRHLDVNNEMLHGSFFKDRLGGPAAWAHMFDLAHKADPSLALFVNDYNVEDGNDPASSPEAYARHVVELQENGAQVGGVGIQCHIDSPVGPTIAAALDRLGELGLPVWLTEVDVAAAEEHVRAEDLEVVLREAYAHPAVGGIMLWGFWETAVWRENSHLVNAEGEVNAAGQRLLDLKKEWMTVVEGAADADGEFRFRGFHGSYVIEVDGTTHSFDVDHGDSPLTVEISL
ncbi:endo-1,4-beta-xylanase 1-like [Wolffia australiana]